MRKESELVGTSLYELVLTDDLLIVDENLKLAQSQAKTVEFDLRLKRADDQIVETRWSASGRKHIEAFSVSFSTLPKRSTSSGSSKTS